MNPRLHSRSSTPLTLVSLVLALGSASLNADPMRPLPGSQTVAATPAAAATGAGAQAPAARSPAPAAASQVAPLLAIRMDSSGQRLALVGQQWLKVGERFSDPAGSFTVLSIAEHHIEIQRGNDRRTAYLLPPLLDSAKPRAVANRSATP